MAKNHNLVSEVVNHVNSTYHESTFGLFFLTFRYPFIATRAIQGTNIDMSLAGLGA